MPFGFGQKRHQQDADEADPDMVYFYDHGRRIESLQTPVNADRNFKGQKIASLNSFNFESVLEEKSAVLVMFYRPNDCKVSTYMDTVCQAARCTKRENHLYAAVDCALEEDLCQAQRIRKTPAYSLYSRANRVGVFTDLIGTTADVMRSYVENAPPIVKSKCENKYVKPVPDPRSSYDDFRDSLTFSSFR